MVDLYNHCKNARGFDFHRKTLQESNEFFLSSGGYPEFWVGSPPMADYMALYAIISKFQPTVLTAAPHVFKHDSREFQAAEEGKRRWVKRYLGEEQEKRMVVTYSKFKHHAVDLSGKTIDILIDDHSSNIKRWNKVGGVGILHTSAQETIDILKEKGYV